jgi:hypothetical protein
MPALKGSAPALCWNHSPAVAAERAAARKNGGRLAVGPPAEIPTLRSASDVMREAEIALAEAKQLPISGRKTTAVVAVLGLALRGLEIGELETRMRNIEQLVKGSTQWEKISRTG